MNRFSETNSIVIGLQIPNTLEFAIELMGELFIALPRSSFTPCAGGRVDASCGFHGPRRAVTVLRKTNRACHSTSLEWSPGWGCRQLRIAEEAFYAGEKVRVSRHELTRRQRQVEEDTPTQTAYGEFLARQMHAVGGLTKKVQGDSS